jgi:hypothetical protein
MGSRNIDMQCWKCGIELKNILLPFSRYEECSSCKTDLHVCISCKNYDPVISDGCREDRADFVLDKDKSNFCDYFKVNCKAYKKKDNSESRQARAQLAALFGEDLQQSEEESVHDDSPQAESDKALAELKRLFGDDQTN